jgi:hypothetical protein
MGGLRRKTAKVESKQNERVSLYFIVINRPDFKNAD